MNSEKPDIAVLIPCYNEVESIASVIGDFKKELPGARIIVFDNYSSDNTFEIAINAGAQVIPVRKRGKGYVVRQMFDTITADICVLVDGDGTYPASAVHGLIEPLISGDADMTVGSRQPKSSRAMKAVNRVGNLFFSVFVSLCFKKKLNDVLSGYRAFTHEVPDKIHILTYRFEIETEITIKTLQAGLRIKEIPVAYEPRTGKSSSKLRPFKDGYAILRVIFILFRDLRPLTFFGIFAVLFWLSALICGLMIYHEQRAAHLFEVIILTSLVITGWLFLLIGFAVHTINNRFSDLMGMLERFRKKTA